MILKLGATSISGPIRHQHIRNQANGTDASKTETERNGVSLPESLGWEGSMKYRPEYGKCDRSGVAQNMNKTFNYRKTLFHSKSL